MSETHCTTTSLANKYACSAVCLKRSDRIKPPKSSNIFYSVFHRVLKFAMFTSER